MTESFRHAILYLIREAYNSGFRLFGTSLEEAEKAIDEELDMRGIPRNDQGDGSEKSGNNLN